MFSNVFQRPVIIQSYHKILQVAISSTARTALLNSKNPLYQTKRLFASPKGDNPGVVLHKINDMRIENLPMPKIQHDNQVLLQMEVVGICGSDVHYYVHGKIGNFILKKPMIIGHEASGTVLECGKKVTHLKPGDRVAIEPQISCRMCSLCKQGKYNLCDTLTFCATPPIDGNLCRYYLHDADFCHKLPKNMDFEHGALIEPLSVGIHCCNRGKITGADSVLIIGAGPIGMVCTLSAKAFGAANIIILDVNDFRLNKAMSLGADYALNVKGCPDEEVVKTIQNTLGHKPNKVIECSGHDSALKLGMKACAKGGKVVLCGLGATQEILITLPELSTGELDIMGIFRYVNDYPRAIALIETGKIDPKPLITHHFKMDDAINAFKTAAEGKVNFIKILIHANPNYGGGSGGKKC